MDPVEPDSLHKALASQGTLLGQHDQELQNLKESNRAILGQVSYICNQLTAMSSQLAQFITGLQPSQPIPLISPQHHLQLFNLYGRAMFLIQNHIPEICEKVFFAPVFSSLWPAATYLCYR